MKRKGDVRMMRNHMVTGRAVSMPAGFAIATSISLGVMLMLSAFLAKLISSEKLEWEKVGYGIAIMLLVTSMNSIFSFILNTSSGVSRFNRFGRDSYIT